MTQGQMYDAASTILAQKLSQVDGVGQVTVGGSSLPAVRVELNPHGAATSTASASKTCARRSPRPMPTAQGRGRGRRPAAGRSTPTTRRRRPREYMPLIIAYRNGAAVRLSDVAEVVDSVEDLRNAGHVQRQAGGARDHLPPARTPTSSRPSTACTALLPQLRASIPSAIDRERRDGAHHDHPRVAARRRAHAGHRRSGW